MSHKDAEQSFIHAFVVPTKRDRYAEMLATPKRRRKFLDSLYHFNDLDPRYMVPIDAARQSADGVGELLRARGAGETCYIISTKRELDAQVLPLNDALDQIVGNGCHASMVSCLAGRLGYFEGEHKGDRCILDRQPDKTMQTDPTSPRRWLPIRYADDPEA